MTAGHPRAFWDTSWLAVPGATSVEMLAALDLADPIMVSWRQGIAAVCGDSWDFEAGSGPYLARVFLPPPIHGWQLVVGGWFGGSESDERLEGVRRICCDLSRRYGRACAFTMQGRMDFYAWTLAHNGAVARHFVWDGEVVADIGKPISAERLRTPIVDVSGIASQEPSEELVAAIAGEWSVNPLALEPTNQDTSSGLLAVTAWGRQHGVALGLSGRFFWPPA